MRMGIGGAALRMPYVDTIFDGSSCLAEKKDASRNCGNNPLPTIKRNFRLDSLAVPIEFACFLVDRKMV